jgi:hypothetical protein
VVHCTNGEVVVLGLAAAGVPGRLLAVGDILHEGPCPAGVTGAAWRQLRAGFIADGDEGRREAIARDMAARDALLDDAAATGDPLVLWYEHDLFDQLNLIWLIDVLATRGVPATAVSLVVIGDHPEVQPFHGLGQLSPEALAALFPARVPLTAEAVETARRAWAAVTAPTPEAVVAEARRPSGALPFLSGALERLLEELPGVHDGLSRVERQGLQAVRGGSGTLGAAFVANAAMEERVFLGDESFYRAMRGLAATPVPLVTLGAGDPDAERTWTVALSEAGRLVLEGARDHAELNGLDRWVGGVHLLGRSPAWRWDGPRGALRGSGQA